MPEKTTPFAIGTEAGDIRITFQLPAQQNTVILLAGCGLDATFWAFDGRRLHVPAQQSKIEILVPGHPIKPETPGAYNLDKAELDYSVANGISLYSFIASGGSGDIPNTRHTQ